MLVLTIIHIVAGTAAFCAGVCALVVRKGDIWHRRSGNLFGITLLITCFAGVVLAMVSLQAITAAGGLIAAYLVVTGWLSLGRAGAMGQGLQTVATLVIVVVAIGSLAIGVLARHDPAGGYQGFPAEDYFYLGAIAVVAAVGDLYWLAVGGYTGKRRIARHLWRMCAGLFFATGSLFTGPGAAVFPIELQGSGLLAAPELIVFLAMVFWLLRLRTKTLSRITSVE